MKYKGKSVTAVTNPVLAAGHGMFVADLAHPGMCSLAFLRSDRAHARIVSIDSSKALAEPGVVAVITGEEIAANTKPVPGAADPAFYGGKTVKSYALPSSRVRYVGEPIAAIVAEDRYTANKARDLVEVSYEDLPVVTIPREAIKPGSPLIEPDWGDNIMIHRDFVRGDVKAGLAGADGVIKGSVTAHRYVASPIEPRAYAANYEPFGDLLTVWSSTQNPHPLRVFLAASLGMGENQVRVIQPHVGGGFGEKVPPFPEEIVIGYAARSLRRPLKWIEERTEHFLAGGHAREISFDFEAGYKRHGQVTTLTVTMYADVGVASTLVGWAMAYVAAYCVPTAFKIPNCHVELFAVTTNKCPWNGYRAFGKEAASYFMDRVMDRVADATGIERAEVRMRNFIRSDEFPYEQVSGAVLDSGDYSKALRRVVELAKVPDFRKEQAEARKKGRRIGLGIGFELTPEGAGLPNSPLLQAYDGATVRIAPSGDVTVLTGVTSPGCGNETGISQIVADTLGVSMDKIRVIQGDTDKCPYGSGNYSSRSLIYGGSAAQLAAQELHDKMLKVASKVLEVSVEDLAAEDNRIYVKGATSRSMPFSDVVNRIYQRTYMREAKEVEPGLESTRYYRIGNIHHEPEIQGKLSPYPTWPFAACISVVEVDPDTGFVRVLRFIAVHDVGTVINPLMVDANMHGGVAQGIGGALYENMLYDEAGQLQTTTFLDYTIPTAVEIPNCLIEHQITPSPFTLLGAKGAGESGVTAPLGAIAAAIEDALPELKLALMETPMTPERVWRAIQEAHQGQS
jgi:aerobic carbon-monoxide dehydrogenase large subunit